MGLAPRFRTLLAIGLTVLFFDQWTKLLAVKHLTPAIAQAHRAATGQPPKVLTYDEQDQVLDDVGAWASIAYFFGDARSPCDPRGARCPRIRVFEGFWDWHYAENRGAAWSSFQNLSDSVRVPFLAGVACAALFGIFWFVRKLADDQKLTIVALSLIAGGAIGNLIDRIRLGYVIDFIEWYAGTYRWPTFNVADSAISTGIGLILLGMLLDMRRSKQRQGSENGPLASPMP
jgi:signal peptidase II